MGKRTKGTRIISVTNNGCVVAKFHMQDASANVFCKAKPKPAACAEEWQQPPTIQAVPNLYVQLVAQELMNHMHNYISGAFAEDASSSISKRRRMRRFAISIDELVHEDGNLQ